MNAKPIRAGAKAADTFVMGNQWVAGPIHGDAAFRLFCFPYAGGTSQIFQTWQDYFSPGIQVMPIELPGRTRRYKEPPFTSAEQLADAAGTALRPLSATPFALFGHSMGALLAFELCRYFRRYGLNLPAQLIVSGAPAPQLPRKRTCRHTWPEAEFLGEIRRLGGTSHAVLGNPELVELLIPTLRADFQICDTYEYRSEEPLNVPITVLGGRQDEEVLSEELEMWGEQTTRGCRVHLLQGSHFFIEEHKSTVLEIINQCLMERNPPSP